MPRSARIDIPNLLQHVIVRGIERRKIFTDDEDRQQFVQRFSQLLLSTETDCLAWALIDNHFHLLLRPRRIPLANFMRRLLTGYAVTFNLRHRRSGHLFQNRYKSLACEEETYLLELVRYIHLNPLRAGLVAATEELDRYPWCGHAVLMGHKEHAGQQTTEVLARFGTTTLDARQRYRLFVQDGIAMGRRNDLIGACQAIAASGEEKGTRDARVLGGEGFVENLLRKTEGEPLPAKVSLEEIVTRVCGTLELAVADLLSPARTLQVALARSLICHLAFAGGHRGVDIARRLRLTGSAVSIACRRGREAIAKYPVLTPLLEPAGF